MKDCQLVETDVFNNFLNNKECVLDFLENLCIPDLNLKDFDNLTCTTFSEHDVVKCRNKDNIKGFTIKGDNTEVYIMNPEYNYMGFWNARNFFTFTLAKHFKHSIDKRYIVNISSKDFKNSLVKFDISPNFLIWNLYEKNEKLENWLNVLYK